MRTALVEELTALARENPDIMLLTGDLGYTVFEPFRDEFPQRYLNCGVAEANMLGTAAGLAREGFKPFVYSFIPFGVFRCYEQLRIDICYHELAVTIVGLGAGYSYGDMGATHHAVEDIAATRCLPSMTVVCPGDPWEVRCATRALASLPGPSYLRLGKRGEPNVHAQRPHFEIGRAITLQKGDGIALVSTSNMLATSVQTAEILQRDHGVTPTVVSMHTVKPLDVDSLRQLAATHRAIYTLEEHSVIGGLGSAVCEALAALPGRCAVYPMGIPDRFVHVSGSQQYYREQCGLTPEKIASSVLENFVPA